MTIHGIARDLQAHGLRVEPHGYNNPGAYHGYRVTGESRTKSALIHESIGILHVVMVGSGMGDHLRILDLRDEDALPTLRKLLSAYLAADHGS